MQAIGRFSIRRHDSDGSSGWLGTAIEDYQLFRVVGETAGSSPRARQQLLRDRAGSRATVALTLEGLDQVGETHIAVCSEVAEVCRRERRRLLICGAGREAMLRLVGAGILEPAGKSIYADLATMVASVTRVDPRGQPSAERAAERGGNRR